MNEFLKYDPEDIESLLLHKHFDELYESERIFVLKHISSAEEYASMREQLLNIRQLMTEPNDSDFFKPDPRSREKLIAYMEESKPKRVLWLNTIAGYFVPEKNYRAVAFRFAIVILACAAGLLIYTSLPESVVKDPVVVETKEPVKPAEPKAEIPAAVPEQNKNSKKQTEFSPVHSDGKGVDDMLKKEDYSEVTTKDTGPSDTVYNKSLSPAQKAEPEEKNTDKAAGIENIVLSEQTNSKSYSAPSNYNTQNVTKSAVFGESKKKAITRKDEAAKLSCSLAESAVLQQLLVEAF